ncbi:cysteine--tRNA ligase [Paraconexibacter sp.]|uniref:cysteine--tRNA ligase n=1 Tax=Paraconexibacter sp. TaxID=2949640 RepID=UPI00356809D6
MREIRLHDTRTASLRALEPRDPGKVGIYACGPTVYARIHVGNARPYVVFSLLKRFLQHEGYDVTFVANITDVNDKIYAAAQQAGVSSEHLAAEMTAHYVADTDALGLGRPDHEPRVVDSIDGIVGLIQALIDRGAAYAAEGDVYFRVRSDPGYGNLSHRHVDDMNQGEGGDGLHLKEDPLDFALWKAQKPGEDTAWDAPWGRGRPGWHIECSAMAEELLGVGFDIHGGGNDLIFPHHENEAAQTRAGRGAELAQIWMHNGMLQTGPAGGDEKMAKSVGNIALLPEVLAQYGRDALIAFFCSAHYRQPISFGDDALTQAQATVRRLREAARRLEVGAPTPPDMRGLKTRFFAALADDFKTPEALAAVFDWVREANRRADAGERVGDADLREMLSVLALDTVLEIDGADATGPDEEARTLLEARQAARAAKDWAAADRLRDELAARGWTVRDGADGAELVRAG